MDTLLMTFLRITRESNAWAPKFVELPQGLGQDLLWHGGTEHGFRQLLDFMGAPYDSSLRDVVQAILKDAEVGKLRFVGTPCSSALASAPGNSPTDIVDLGAGAEAIDLGIRHAIVIELIGEDERPVSGVEYQVVLPNGEIREGALDENGRAELLELVDPGACKISFPTLDKDAWEYVHASPL